MKKETLVLIPALFCNHRLFEAQVKTLSFKYDVIIASNTGHPVMASLADDILNNVPDKFALAGISMGGYVALEIMRRASDRVSKLILMDTSARADNSQQVEKRLDAIASTEKGFYLEIISNMFPVLLHPNNRENDKIIQKLRAMAQETGADNFINQMKAIMTRIDSRPFLKDIKCPTLVLCGRQDLASPIETMEEIHKNINGSQFVIIEECGHLSPLEKPNAVTSAIWNFL